MRGKTNRLIRRVAECVLCLTLVQLCAAGPAFAQGKSARKLNKAAERAQKAARVFTQIMAAPDKAIPKDLIDKAEAVAVFPNVIKAGFIVGGRGGNGVISRRVR